MTRLVAASATDIGRVRSQNQDCALVADNLVAVADGMGGHAGGDVAARMAVEVLAEAFARRRTAVGLVAAVKAANEAILDRSERERELRGMGTTLSAAAVVADRDGDRLALVHVGDSRVYLRRGGVLTQLTDDHSVVEEMVRHGELSPDEAAIHPQRHILTRALGIDRGIEVDAQALPAEPGVRLLLCSDGLTNEVGTEEIGRILDEHPDPAAAARALVARALEHGGSDNVTVVVADLLAAGDAGDLGSQRSRPLTSDVPARSDPPARSDVPGTGGPDVRARGQAAGPAARARATAARAATEVDAQRSRRSRAVAGGASRQRPRPERVVTLWSVLFVVLFVGVLGAIAGFTEWYVNSTYYLGISGGRVAIFEGRPGGFLWFRPKVVEVLDTTPAQVFAPYRPMLRAGMIETSYGDAVRVAQNLTNVNRFFATTSTG